MSQKASSTRVRNVVSSADHAELEKAYTFVPPSSINSNDALNGNSRGGGSTWQDRMVQKYHEGLYKEFALADLSRPGQLGLRWRTRQEVVDGRGERSCGNKICHNKNDLVTLEVPFSYEERGVAKKELVKLRLCPACRPMVDKSRRRLDPNSGRKGREAGEASDANHDADSSSWSSSSSSSSSSRRRSKRKRRKKERSRRHKKRHKRGTG